MNIMTIIFGQADYAHRIAKYIRDGATKIFSFPLSGDDPTAYIFDFSRYDDELKNIPKNAAIIVAFGRKYLTTAAEHLRGLGFTDLRLFDAPMDNEMKKAFFKREFALRGKTFSLIDEIGEEKSVRVYMAKSVVDKPAPNFPKRLSKYITPIQVGAALTDKRIADVTDDTGDNISARNRHYSETTALYWMWKNVAADYLGLCHYRRLWKNLDAIADALQGGDYDVVLPVPTLCADSVMKDYMERYIPDVYPTMLDVLREMSPEYYEASWEIYGGDVFYACNMLIAKRETLDSLCGWMFPMVEEIENRVGDLPDAYQNRYAGFCAERLITLYFLRNKQKWRIAHAEKIFVG